MQDDKSTINQDDKKSEHSQSGRAAGILDTFIKTKSSLKFFLSRFMISTDDIDDISQEAFLRAFKEEQKRTIEQPKAFLFRIAKNLVLSELRKKSRKVTDYIEDYEYIDVLGSDSLENSLISQQKLGIYCEAVATLPPQCRRVILMKKIYGMSCKEISTRLNISISTVEKHLVKGVRQTNDIIDERYSENTVYVDKAGEIT